MDLMQLDPFTLLRDIDRYFDGGRRSDQWVPAIDVLDREAALVIRVAVPGVAIDDIDVTIEDRNLTIAGNRSFGEEAEGVSFHRREIPTGGFKRTLVLPDGLNPAEIKAGAVDGILEISIPRRPEVLPRKVKVDVTH